MVIDLLDKSLVNCHNEDFVDVIRQITSNLQTLHQNGIVHGDIKPENIMCFPKEAGSVTEWCLIDFGLSHIMNDGECLDLVNNIAGTWLYCSRNIHFRLQSYKNDFESLAFVIIHHIKRTLPWLNDCVHQNKSVRGNAKGIRENLMQTIYKKKEEMVKQAAEIGLPYPFQTFVEACFKIDDFEMPPHIYLKNILG